MKLMMCDSALRPLPFRSGRAPKDGNKRCVVVSIITKTVNAAPGSLHDGLRTENRVFRWLADREYGRQQSRTNISTADIPNYTWNRTDFEALLNQLTSSFAYNKSRRTSGECLLGVLSSF